MEKGGRDGEGDLEIFTTLLALRRRFMYLFNEKTADVTITITILVASMIHAHRQSPGSRVPDFLMRRPL